MRTAGNINNQTLDHSSHLIGGVSRGNTEDILATNSKNKYDPASLHSSQVSPRSQQLYNQTIANNPFNQTNQSIGHVSSQTNTANIKGKISAIEELIRQIQEDLQFHKQEVAGLKLDKSALEQNLTLQTQDVRKTLTNELFKVEEDIKRHFAGQKQDNARFQQQITAFRGEKTALDMQMLELERRMNTLEYQVGGQ